MSLELFRQILRESIFLVEANEDFYAKYKKIYASNDNVLLLLEQLYKKNIQPKFAKIVFQGIDSKFISEEELNDPKEAELLTKFVSWIQENISNFPVEARDLNQYKTFEDLYKKFYEIFHYRKIATLDEIEEEEKSDNEENRSANFPTKCLLTKTENFIAYFVNTEEESIKIIDWFGQYFDGRRPNWCVGWRQNNQLANYQGAGRRFVFVYYVGKDKEKLENFEQASQVAYQVQIGNKDKDRITFFANNGDHIISENASCQNYIENVKQIDPEFWKEFSEKIEEVRQLPEKSVDEDVVIDELKKNNEYLYSHKGNIVHFSKMKGNKVFVHIRKINVDSDLLSSIDKHSYDKIIVIDKLCIDVSKLKPLKKSTLSDIINNAYEYFPNYALNVSFNQTIAMSLLHSAMRPECLHDIHEQDFYYSIKKKGNQLVVKDGRYAYLGFFRADDFGGFLLSPDKNEKSKMQVINNISDLLTLIGIGKVAFALSWFTDNLGKYKLEHVPEILRLDAFRSARKEYRNSYDIPHLPKQDRWEAWCILPAENRLSTYLNYLPQKHVWEAWNMIPRKNLSSIPIRILPEEFRVEAWNMIPKNKTYSSDIKQLPEEYRWKAWQDMPQINRAIGHIVDLPEERVLEAWKGVANDRLSSKYIKYLPEEYRLTAWNDISPDNINATDIQAIPKKDRLAAMARIRDQISAGDLMLVPKEHALSVWKMMLPHKRHSYNIEHIPEKYRTDALKITPPIHTSIVNIEIYPKEERLGILKFFATPELSGVISRLDSGLIKVLASVPEEDQLNALSILKPFFASLMKSLKALLRSGTDIVAYLIEAHPLPLRTKQELEKFLRKSAHKHDLIAESIKNILRKGLLQ